MLKVQEIRELIKLIDQSSINEFTYETNGTSVTMKKSGGKQSAVQWDEDSQAESQKPAASQPETIPVQPESAVKPVEAKGAEEPEKTGGQNYDYEIVSPMV